MYLGFFNCAPLFFSFINIEFEFKLLSWLRFEFVYFLSRSVLWSERCALH